MREVRWVLQVSKPGQDFWKDRSDKVYDGWFHSVGEDEPSPTVLEAYEDAVENLDWFDVRLVQEVRSFTRTVLKETRREKDDEGN